MGRLGYARAFLATGALAACVGASQRYALEPKEVASPVSGSLEVERVEGGERLVVVELDELPPPEKLAPHGDEFGVWIEDARGQRVRVGTLLYDRKNRSGNMMATTALSSFTVQVTAEDSHGHTPAGSVVVAERKVTSN